MVNVGPDSGTLPATSIWDPIDKRIGDIFTLAWSYTIAAAAIWFVLSRIMILITYANPDEPYLVINSINWTLTTLIIMLLIASQIVSVRMIYTMHQRILALELAGRLERYDSDDPDSTDMTIDTSDLDSDDTSDQRSDQDSDDTSDQRSDQDSDDTSDQHSDDTSDQNPGDSLNAIIPDLGISTRRVLYQFDQIQPTLTALVEAHNGGES